MPFGPMLLAAAANSFIRSAGGTFTTVTHVATAAGPQTFYNGAGGTTTNSHTITPSGATAGRYAIVELGMSPNPAVTGGTAVITPPSGWTLIASGWKSGTPSGQYASYGKILTGSDSWTWTYDVVSNVASVYRLFDGVNPNLPLDLNATGIAVNATTQTTRVTPSVTTLGQRYIVYSANDRSGSTLTTTDSGTLVGNVMSSSATVWTARAGAKPSGTYQYTWTGGANTSVGWGTIMSLYDANYATAVVRRAAGNVNAVTSATATPTYPTNVVGDYLVMSLVTAGTPSATPSGWTLLGSDTTNAASAVYVYGQPVTTVQSGSASITLTASAVCRSQIMSYSGVNTALTPTSTHAGSTTATTAMTSPSFQYTGGYAVWVHGRTAASTLSGQASADASWVPNEGAENSGTNAMTVTDGPLAFGVTTTFSATSNASVAGASVVVALPSGTPVPTQIGTSTTGTSTGSTVTVSVPSGVAAGNLMVAALSFNTDDTLLTQTGWTLAASTGSAAGALNGVYYRIATASEPSTYTFNSTASTASSAAMSVFNGVSATTPLDTTPVATSGTGTTQSAGPITTTTPNALLFYSSVARTSSDNVTVDGALITLTTATTGRRISTAMELMGTAGASTARTFGGTTSVPRSALVVAFRAGSS